MVTVLSASSTRELNRETRNMKLISFTKKKELRDSRLNEEILMETPLSGVCNARQEGTPDSVKQRSGFGKDRVWAEL